MCDKRERDLFFFLTNNVGEISQGIKEQTRQVLLNMSNVLEASGSSLDKVVKTTVFLKDMNDFNSMNEVYASVSSRVDHQA